jgi:hypothetical protein
MKRDRDGGRPSKSLWKGPALIAALILVIPLLGNRFVEGWNWPPRAFVFFGVLIFAIGVTYKLITRNVDTIAYRSALGLALVTGFVLFFGNFVQAADDVYHVPAALMYLIVPVLGIIGAAIARFHSRGMSRALFVTAIAQAVVFAIALSRNLPVTTWTPPVWRGFGGNALFLVLFVVSALLFRTAARGESSPGTA